MKFLFCTFVITFFNISYLLADIGSFPKVDSDINLIKSTAEQMKNDFNKIPADDQNIEWVKSKISHMFKLDQYFRMAYQNIPVEHEYSAEERKYFLKAIGHLIYEIDSNNTADIKSLIQIYQWFKISLFGEEIDRMAWLLVQHADDDPELQKSVLVVLEELVKTNETNPTNFAYLFDRVAASWSDPTKRKLQRFGTQGQCIEINKWQPIPIEEPDKVNIRRAAVGLPAIEEYQSYMNKYCR